MVPPKSLTERYRAQLGFYPPLCRRWSSIRSRVFLDEGYFEAHINRMRKSYRAQRRGHRHHSAKPARRARCRVSGEDADCTSLLTIDTKCTDHVLRADAEGRGVRLSFLSDFALSPDAAKPHTLVVNYPWH